MLFICLAVFRVGSLYTENVLKFLDFQGCGGSKAINSPLAPSPQSAQQPPSGGDQSYPIFLSFRVLEARKQALALKAALEANGYKTFCSEADIPRGKDWIRTISEALDKCRMVIVLATTTYGGQGTDAFATGEGEYTGKLGDFRETACASRLNGLKQVALTDLNTDFKNQNFRAWRSFLWVCKHAKAVLATIYNRGKFLVALLPKCRARNGQKDKEGALHCPHGQAMGDRFTRRSHQPKRMTAKLKREEKINDPHGEGCKHPCTEGLKHFACALSKLNAWMGHCRSDWPSPNFNHSHLKRTHRNARTKEGSMLFNSEPHNLCTRVTWAQVEASRRSNQLLKEPPWLDGAQFLHEHSTQALPLQIATWLGNTVDDAGEEKLLTACKKWYSLCFGAVTSFQCCFQRAYITSQVNLHEGYANTCALAARWAGCNNQDAAGYHANGKGEPCVQECVLCSHHDDPRLLRAEITKKEDPQLHPGALTNLETYVNDLVGKPWTTSPDKVPNELLEDLLSCCKDIPLEAGQANKEKIEQGKQETAIKDQKWTPLLRAAKQGNLTEVKELLAQGAATEDELHVSRSCDAQRSLLEAVDFPQKVPEAWSPDNNTDNNTQLANCVAFTLKCH
eukprot:1150513-Pelagomonas_calceolata.AAC.2